MPVGSTIVATKQALIDALNDRPGLDGVLVSYGDPGDQARKEMIWVGDIRIGSQEPVAIRATPIKREETYELWVNVTVAGKATNEKNEIRALELVHEVEELLSVDPKLSNEVDGLLWAIVTEMSLSTTQGGDGPITTAVVTVEVKARLLQ